MAAETGGMIIRDNLIRLFDELLDEGLVYVCAPAGYGKTVAVLQWLDSNKHARAVIPLDEYDNSFNHFCARFCTALRACQPQNEALAAIVSHPAFGSAPDEFALRAIAALRGRKRTILVIDDLHFISEQKVLDFLLIILRRLPESFRIVLISRNELPSGFSDLWLRGSLVKITAKQLRFSQEETMLLYKKRGSPVTPEQAQNIRRFTDGWAIGISALLLSGGKPSGEGLEYLDEFIRFNIWDKWDEATREFMLSTAAARELDPSLCSALSGISGSERVLHDLMQSGAFIFQTSDGIYRYHHLFHNFLRHTLEERGSEYLYSLLEKEGEWHLSRQDFYSAAECFIRCKNHDGIANCFDLLEIADRNEFVIERMLPIIKSPEIESAAEKYPFLFYMLAWAAFAEGRVDDTTRYMDCYYARFPEIAARDPARAHNLLLMRFMDFRTGLLDLKNNIAALPLAQNPDGGRGSITMNMPLLHRSSRDFSELAGAETEAVIAELAGMVGWVFGEESRLLIGSLTAGLLYEQGHLEKAHLHAIAANAEIKPHFAPESKFCAISILTCILDAMGDRHQAELTLSGFEAVIESDKAYYLYRNFKALAVRRKLAKGDIQAAESWLSEYEAAQHGSLSCYAMFGTFTACRAYITTGNYDAAIVLLTKALELTRVYNRPLGIIEANILLAIAYWKKKRGFQETALQHLESAAALAYGYGYTQIFINEGAELVGMLRRLQKRAEQPGKGDALSTSFIKLLYMNALEHQDSGLTSGQAEQSTKYTDKQKTVMKLLCEGKSYREIADTMGIKLTTLRSHIALIYKKLGVTSEIDAIMKIKASGILNRPQA